MNTRFVYFFRDFGYVTTIDEMVTIVNKDDRTCFLQKSEIPLKILRISVQVRAFHLFVDYK